MIQVAVKSKMYKKAFSMMVFSSLVFNQAIIVKDAKCVAAFKSMF